MIYSKKKYSQGFTLIEVLVAIAILSIGIVALNIMQIRSVQGNDQGSTISEINWVAMDCIEQLQQEGYSDLVAYDTSVGGNSNGSAGLDDIINPDGEADVDDYPGFRVLWNTAKGIPDSDTVKVRVYVIRKYDGKKRPYDFFVASFL